MRILLLVLMLSTLGSVETHWNGNYGTAGESSGSNASPQERMEGAPPLILWAWARPEDLLFIDPRRVGVAFLAATCRLAGDEVTVSPRLQRLQVPAGTFLEAVVRVETNRVRAPKLGDGQCERLVESILNATASFETRAVQVDFDAAVSQRVFYLRMLRGLRSRLPGRTALSVTGLASWCIHDPWIATAPVDEVVPMLFRMGADGGPVRRLLRAGGDFSLAASRESVGISTDEELPVFHAGRRIYIFHPKPWSREAFQKITGELKQCGVGL